MARKRDHAAEYARRQARARELGFESYYARRTRPTPSAQAPRGERLARLRGHRGRKDLLRELERGNVAVIAQAPDHDATRDESSGQYDRIVLDVQLKDGRTQAYHLHGGALEGQQIEQLRGAISAAGAGVYVNPSLDILGLLEEQEPEEAEWAEFEESA